MAPLHRVVQGRLNSVRHFVSWCETAQFPRRQERHIDLQLVSMYIFQVFHGILLDPPLLVIYVNAPLDRSSRWSQWHTADKQFI